jgi:hypothetical protein
VAGAKEGVAFIDEFLSAGFSEAEIVRRCHNPRSRERRVEVAEVVAVR